MLSENIYSKNVNSVAHLMDKDNQSYSVLIIEDNPGDYFLIQEFLEEQMHAPRLDHVETYQEAIIALSERGGVYDVILLDLSLPDASGEALIEDMLIYTGKTPVIVLTGYTDLRYAISSLARGLSDYILKEDLNASVLYKSIRYNIERYKYIETIQESKKRYSDLFQICPIPMWVLDLNNLHIMDVNEAAIRNYGYSREAFLQMTVLELHPEESISDIERILKLSAGNKNFYFQGLFKHLKENGDEIFVDIRSNMLSVNDKSAIVLANDVTDRIQHTITIEKQNEKLKEVAWLQSHVVRAPLARMMGLIHLILDEEQSKEDQKQYLMHILNAANELDDIVKDVVNKSQEIKLTRPNK